MSKAQVGLRVLVAGAVLMSATYAHALTYAPLTLQQITERSDTWVDARIIECPSRSFGDGIHGEITVRLEVRRSAGAPVPREITLRDQAMLIGQVSTNCATGDRVLVALLARDSTGASEDAFALQGWIGIDRRTGSGSTTFEHVWPSVTIGSSEPTVAVSADVFWRWLQDVRASIDAVGRVEAEPRSRWEAELEGTDWAAAGLAIAYLDTLDPSIIDAARIVPVIERLYLRSSASDAAVSVQQRNALLSWGTRIIARSGSGEAINRLIDLIDRDAERRSVDDDVIAEMVASLAGAVTEDESATRLLAIVGARIAFDLQFIRAIEPNASFRLADLLFDAIENPAAYGITSELQSGALWTQLARLGDARIENLLLDVVDTRNERSDVWLYAVEALVTLERTLYPRQERLERWAAQLAAGRLRYVQEIASDIRPQDRFLIPVLAGIEARTFEPQGFHEGMFVSRIVRTIPDPAFIPLLRELSAGDHSEVLHALAECGDLDFAFELALARLASATDVRSTTAYGEVSQRIEALEILGNTGRPEAGDVILRYLDPEWLERLRVFLARQPAPFGVRDQDRPYRMWQLRDAALLALAKSGDPRAHERLRQSYRAGDIRERRVAAIALHYLGDDIGRNLIEPFRNGTERRSPEVEERWQVDLAANSDITHAIGYLDDPRLDAIGFDRLSRRFAPEDTDLAVTLAGRHRARIVAILADALDSADPAIRGRAAHALRLLTRETVELPDSALRVHQQPAIRVWKEIAARERQ
jgi:hypothetical protein